MSVISGARILSGVSDEPSHGAEQVRAAEVIGPLCLATDLGMGFPFEHGLHTTLVASRLADRLGVDPATTQNTPVFSGPPL